VAKLSELKILVVENNAHMRAILVTVLRAFGAQRILEADGPLGGFSLIATEDIDLVLLDFFLGDHDGYDIVELLRGERPRHGTRGCWRRWRSAPTRCSASRSRRWRSTR